MRLRVFWYQSVGDHGLNPACTIVEPVVDEKQESLANYLMDDGGGGYSAFVPWIDEQISAIDSVERGERESSESVLESWAARISRDGAEIYSLYDESYPTLVPLSTFRRALLAWREHLQTAPALDLVREIDC